MGDTPLHLATRNGHKDAVRALLQGGADPNMRDEVRSPLLLHVEEDGKERERGGGEVEGRWKLLD